MAIPKSGNYFLFFLWSSDSNKSKWGGGCCQNLSLGGYWSLSVMSQTGCPSVLSKECALVCKGELVDWTSTVLSGTWGSPVGVHRQNEIQKSFDLHPAVRHFYTSIIGRLSPLVGLCLYPHFLILFLASFLLIYVLCDFKTPLS